eukprot:TRINITY_DN29462_c0_g1_i1.p2 TRINITY_DN29462_c0_g1~~TRINITY_DN29462_c0_g1_i1.p2  ORF type:complete len:137 (+),score=9.02 TRINITY_DN29462_c0_g1_i1:137-547(+)
MSLLTVPMEHAANVIIPVPYTRSKDEPFLRNMMHALTQQAPNSLSMTFWDVKGPPGDVLGESEVMAQAGIGYLSVVLNDAHLTGDQLDSTLRFLLGFPEQLHYWAVSCNLMVRMSMRRKLTEMQNVLQSDTQRRSA